MGSANWCLCQHVERGSLHPHQVHALLVGRSHAQGMAREDELSGWLIAKT